MKQLSIILTVCLFAGVDGRCPNGKLVDGNKLYVCDPDNLGDCACLEECSLDGNIRWIFFNEIGQKKITSVCPKGKQCFSGYGGVVRKCATQEDIDHVKNAERKETAFFCVMMISSFLLVIAFAYIYSRYFSDKDARFYLKKQN